MPASNIQVHLDSKATTVLVGSAFITARRKTTSTTFRYDSTFLANSNSWPISPELALIGQHWVAGLPGAMADSAPDRWGRALIEKKINADARSKGETPPTVTEVDYLLGVSDLMRHGALRYKIINSDEFQSPGTDVPLLVDLPKVLNATDSVTNSESQDDMETIKILLDAGSASLGGARPKATIKDGDGFLISKFPHHSDEWDVMAWEITALDLAHGCGILIPTRRLENIGGRNVLLLQRFDRKGSERIPYISAMTMLGATDDISSDYIELAEAISEHSGSVVSDLEQLWRRIAFSIAIHNTDDHMRNHGFLRGRSGWSLSPAFDINPNPNAASGRMTSIGYETRPEKEQQGLMDSARYFHLDAPRAMEIWLEIVDVVANWRAVASSYGISKAEQNRFAPVLDRFG